MTQKHNFKFWLAEKLSSNLAPEQSSRFCHHESWFLRFYGPVWLQVCLYEPKFVWPCVDRYGDGVIARTLCELRSSLGNPWPQIRFKTLPTAKPQERGGIKRRIVADAQKLRGVWGRAIIRSFFFFFEDATRCFPIDFVWFSSLFGASFLLLVLAGSEVSWRKWCLLKVDVSRASISCV